MEKRALQLLLFRP